MALQMSRTETLEVTSGTRASWGAPVSLVSCCHLAGSESLHSFGNGFPPALHLLLLTQEQEVLTPLSRLLHERWIGNQPPRPHLSGLFFLCSCSELSSVAPV